MLRTTIKKNLASPTPKQNDELCLQQNEEQHAPFCDRDVVSKKNKK